jgi:hypothetical protein
VSKRCVWVVEGKHFQSLFWYPIGGDAVRKNSLEILKKYRTSALSEFYKFRLTKYAPVKP